MKKRADGRYCKQILVGYKPDGTKKVKTIYGKTIKEVEKKERELRREIDDGVDVCENITVAEWADIWIKTYKSNVEYNTEKRYRSTIDNQIKPTIGFYELKYVTSEIIQNEINKLSQHYSASTIKKYKITLNQMFSSALISGKIKNNPTLGVVVPEIKDEKTDEFKFIPKSISAYIPEFCETYKNGSLIMVKKVKSRTNFRLKKGSDFLLSTPFCIVLLYGVFKALFLRSSIRISSAALMRAHSESSNSISGVNTVFFL